MIVFCVTVCLLYHLYMYIIIMNVKNYTDFVGNFQVFYNFPTDFVGN